MPATIIFDTSVAGGVKSKSTKSEVPAASGYCDDLIGCGDNTHTRYSFQGSFNGLLNCTPPTQVYLISGKGLELIDMTVLIEQPPVNSAEYMGDLHRYLMANVAQTASSPSTAPTSPQGIIQAGAPFIIRGNSYVSRTDNNNTVIQVSIPRTEQITDICGDIVGTKGSTSVSVTIKETESCRPSLTIQASLSVYVTAVPGYVTVGAGAYDALYNQSQMSQVNAAIPKGQAADCNGLPADAFAVVGSQFGLPSTITLG